MKNCSEKEISVFNGVLSLCKEGKKIYNITVQDIATAANMGKGTLYEYFSSKEEIILNTVLYVLRRENSMLEDVLAQQTSFKEKMSAVYDIVCGSFNDGAAVVGQLVSGSPDGSLSQLFESSSGRIAQVMQEKEQAFYSILKCGEAEGVLSLDWDADYLRMAVSSNLIGLKGADCAKCGGSPCQFEQKKTHAYTLLLKSLN